MIWSLLFLAPLGTEAKDKKNWFPGAEAFSSSISQRPRNPGLNLYNQSNQNPGSPGSGGGSRGGSHGSDKNIKHQCSNSKKSYQPSP